jgi:hypothetical protein
MTFQEWVKALPEKERYKFFEAMIAVSEAGRKAGVPADEWAKMYVDVHSEIHQQLKEKDNA